MKSSLRVTNRTTLG